MTDRANREGNARRRLLDRHRETLATTLAAADAVAADWPDDAATDRSAVVEPLDRELRERGVLERLPTVLSDAADVAGVELQAEPVALPPYVVVTSTGPVLRATGATGRLVVSVAAFVVERGATTRYRRGPGTLDEALRVEFRRG